MKIPTYIVLLCWRSLVVLSAPKREFPVSVWYAFGSILAQNTRTAHPLPRAPWWSASFLVLAGGCLPIIRSRHTPGSRPLLLP